MTMNLKIRSKSGHQITVAWGGVLALCLVVIPTCGLMATADEDDQRGILYNQEETAELSFTIDLNKPQSATPYYTISKHPNTRPFCINGMIDVNFVQFGKFSVSSDYSGQRLKVQILISSISVHDQGAYVIQVFPYNDSPISKRQIVQVRVPPGPADCYQIISGFHKKWVEIHCEAKSGNVDSTISCFQSESRIPYIDGTRSNGVKTRGEFWYTPPFPVRCCSHAASDSISEESCKDYIWPPVMAHTQTNKPSAMSTQSNDIVHVIDDHGMMASESSEYGRSSGHKLFKNELVMMIVLYLFTLI